MSYRGAGGFGMPILRAPRRRAAGDFSDLSDFGWDESSGLDLSTPDFSDVIGGSSSTADFGTMDSSSGLSWDSLSGIGGAIQKYLPSALSLGSLGGAVGSAAAAGASALSSPTARRALKRMLGASGRSRRRMNPGNFKALRRSMHRLQAFERAARKVVHFTHPKPTARVKFRFRRRRKR